MKVAVVRNRSHSGVISTLGQRSPEVYSEKTVQRVADALTGGGHVVMLCEGDKGLLPTLERFMPVAADGRVAGMVFNMAYGIQGECRYTHVPAMLEMAGVPYTGSGPLGHALALDKVITKKLLGDAGIPIPEYRVTRGPGGHVGDLRFPVVVKPRHESTSFGVQLVRDREQLGEAVEAIVAQYQQDALVEEYVDGREICVALLGNEDVQVLPFVEQDFGDRETRMVTWEDKNHKNSAETRRICQAVVSGSLAARLRDVSLATFRACHCKDFARVDVRINAAGEPYVLEINSMASLGTGASYVLAAQTAGYSFEALVNRILDVAHRRYFGAPAPRGKPEAERAAFASVTGQDDAAVRLTPRPDGLPPRPR